MLPKVYVETTIVSYLTGRPSREVVALAHHHVTRQWWETKRSQYELYASEVVIAEHVSIAAVHGMQYLLTWNCRHIANAVVIRIVERICRLHGYEPPVICTPEELMGRPE